MSLVLAVCNQKGGCGKTTASVNLAAFFAHLGKKTLLVDCDFQANASSYLGLRIAAKKNGQLLSQGLLYQKPLKEILVKTSYENLDLVAGDMELGRINREKILEPGSHSLLKSWLECEQGEQYNVIVVDSHPSLDLLFQNVMTAADYYILPLWPEPDSFDGLGLMFSEISAIQNKLNSTLYFLGCVITRMKEKNSTHKKFLKKIESFAERHHMKLLGTIPDSDAVASSTDAQKPLLYYLPNLRVTKAYKKLAKSLVKDLKVRRGRTPKTPSVSNKEENELLNDDFELMDVKVSF